MSRKRDVYLTIPNKNKPMNKILIVDGEPNIIMSLEYNIQEE